MNKILLILFLLITPFLKSQVVFNTSHHNFGEVNSEDQKYFDFTLTNAGKVPAYILRIEEPYGIDAKFSNKEIAPDSTVIVRIKYTPKRREI